MASIDSSASSQASSPPQQPPPAVPPPLTRFPCTCKGCRHHAPGWACQNKKLGKRGGICKACKQAAMPCKCEHPACGHLVNEEGRCRWQADKQGGLFCKTCRVVNNKKFPCTCNASLHEDGQQCPEMVRNEGEFCGACKKGCFQCCCFACDSHTGGPCKENVRQPDGMCKMCRIASLNEGIAKCTTCGDAISACCRDPRNLCKNHLMLEEGTLPHKEFKYGESEINAWLQHHTSVHANDKTCVVCMEEGVRVYSMWDCQCAPSVCEDCLDKVDRCPMCRDDGLPFYRLSAFDLNYLITHRFSDASLEHILASGYRMVYPNHNLFRPSCLITTCKDVQHAVKLHEVEMKMEVDADVQAKAFHLAVDNWNLPYDLSQDVRRQCRPLVSLGYDWWGRDFRSIMGRRHNIMKLFMLRTIRW